MDSEKRKLLQKLKHLSRCVESVTQFLKGGNFETKTEMSNHTLQFPSEMHGYVDSAITSLEGITRLVSNNSEGQQCFVSQCDGATSMKEVKTCVTDQINVKGDSKDTCAINFQSALETTACSQEHGSSHEQHDKCDISKLAQSPEEKLKECHFEKKKNGYELLPVKETPQKLAEKVHCIGFKEAADTLHPNLNEARLCLFVNIL